LSEIRPFIFLWAQMIPKCSINRRSATQRGRATLAITYLAIAGFRLTPPWRGWSRESPRTTDTVSQHLSEWPIFLPRLLTNSQNHCRHLKLNYNSSLRVINIWTTYVSRRAEGWSGTRRDWGDRSTSH
jgi:hypothetical protein